MQERKAEMARWTGMAITACQVLLIAATVLPIAWFLCAFSALPGGIGGTFTDHSVFSEPVVYGAFFYPLFVIPLLVLLCVGLSLVVRRRTQERAQRQKVHRLLLTSLICGLVWLLWLGLFTLAPDW
jgi:nitric oxide reductase large subunit